MINVAPAVPQTNDIAALVAENIDALATYATHLVGDADDAVEFVAGGIHHASKYPPLHLAETGRAALYRAVTRACRHEHRYPPRPHGPARFFKRGVPPLVAHFDGAAEARRVNTVKRALLTISFDRRAALLLRDLAGLSYRDMATALECSPAAVARQLAAARRDFGTIYREIAL